MFIFCKDVGGYLYVGFSERFLVYIFFNSSIFFVIWNCFLWRFFFGVLEVVKVVYGVFIEVIEFLEFGFYFII